METFDKHNHSVTRLHYHVIFVCKYRRKVIDDITKELLTNVFYEIAQHANFKILHIGFDGDHVHLFVTSVPSVSVTQIIRRLKQVSTNRLWKRHEQHLKKYFWKRHVLWTSGYYCSTVGQMSENTLIQYIKNQGNSSANLKN